MNPEHAPRVLSCLKDAVAILACPAEAQKLWLQRLGTYPCAGELALDFDDWAGLAPQLLEEGLVGSDAIAALERVADLLDALHSEPGSWDADTALASSTQWLAVREAAGSAVALLVTPTTTLARP